jgi:hypothetical protein
MRVHTLVLYIYLARRSGEARRVGRQRQAQLRASGFFVLEAGTAQDSTGQHTFDTFISCERLEVEADSAL